MLNCVIILELQTGIDSINYKKSHDYDNFLLSLVNISFLAPTKIMRSHLCFMEYLTANSNLLIIFI